jgi:hypothetical protein
MRLDWVTSTVSRDYKGDTLPTDARLDQLCQALQLSRDEMLNLAALLRRARTARRDRAQNHGALFAVDTGERGLAHAAGLPTAAGREFTGPRQRVHAPDGLYIGAQVIAVIRAKEGTDRFDRSKLLRLIEELNDNYLRGHSYAAHALLRAILDHVPPLLECSDFTAAVNNYRWNRTDKSYMRKLLDFKLQADDVLHRQISSKADLLSLDDMPPRVWINRLLQECASLRSAA